MFNFFKLSNKLNKAFPLRFLMQLKNISPLLLFAVHGLSSGLFYQSLLCFTGNFSILNYEVIDIHAKLVQLYF